MLQQIIARKRREVLNLVELLVDQFQRLAFQRIEVVRKLMVEHVVKEIPNTHRPPSRIGQCLECRLQFGDRADPNFVPVEEFVVEPVKYGFGILNRRIFQADGVEHCLQDGKRVSLPWESPKLLLELFDELCEDLLTVDSFRLFRCHAFSWYDVRIACLETREQIFGCPRSFKESEKGGEIPVRADSAGQRDRFDRVAANCSRSRMPQLSESSASGTVSPVSGSMSSGTVVCRSASSSASIRFVSATFAVAAASSSKFRSGV